MGFVSFKERGVGHLPRWSVGHAHQARLWISGVQGSEHSASSVPMSPVGGESGDSACLCVVNGGHPSLAQVAGQWRGDTALTLPLFWRRSTVSPVFFGFRGRVFTLSSPSHSVPVPNRPSRLRGRKATWKQARKKGYSALWPSECWRVAGVEVSKFLPLLYDNQYWIRTKADGGGGGGEFSGQSLAPSPLLGKAPLTRFCQMSAILSGILSERQRKYVQTV